MSRHDEFAQKNQVVKIAIGTGALICLLAGLVIYNFAASFGIDHETAELVAIAFLVAGAADYLILRFWDRIAARRNS